MRGDTEAGAIRRREVIDAFEELARLEAISISNKLHGARVLSSEISPGPRFTEALNGDLLKGASARARTAFFTLCSGRLKKTAIQVQGRQAPTKD